MKPISLEEVVQMSNCNRTPDQEEFAEDVATYINNRYIHLFISHLTINLFDQNHLNSPS